MAGLAKRSVLKVWLDVIFAIFLREIKSTFSDKFGLSWALISPMIMIVVIVGMRGGVDGGNTHGIPTICFALFGVVLVQFFLGVLEKSSSAIQKNKPLYAFRQVQPISSVLALTGFELLVKVALVLVLIAIGFLLRIEANISDPLCLIFISLQVWLIATSLGLLFGLAKCYVPEVGKVQALITRPMFFISGIFFSLQDVPKEYWPYLNWNPLLHAVELSRFVSYPSYGDAGVSMDYLNMATLVSVFLAMSCYHIGWKRAISR